MGPHRGAHVGIAGLLELLAHVDPFQDVEGHEIFTNKAQDQNFLRQLFSPTFIVWMTDEAPEKFAFELEDGVMCCNVKRHKKSAPELDRMRGAAAHIAKRVRDEIRRAQARRLPEAR
jgi:hypothetical protein